MPHGWCAYLDATAVPGGAHAVPEHAGSVAGVGSGREATGGLGQGVSACGIGTAVWGTTTVRGTILVLGTCRVSVS